MAAGESLILASASVRRRELLERVGVAIEVRPADIDETPLAGEAPPAYVARIADAKVRAAAVRNPGRWVLAADTTVTICGAILGKAESAAEAVAMVRQLAGRLHQVITAVALEGPGTASSRRLQVATDVEMLALDAAAVAAYVATGEWRGKAGAYAIQGVAAAFVAGVRGSVTNVIGLPLAEVLALLRDAGAPGPDFARAVPA